MIDLNSEQTAIRDGVAAVFSRFPDQARFGTGLSQDDARHGVPQHAAQVRRVRGVLEGLSVSIATPDEARSILALKGRDNVAS